MKIVYDSQIFAIQEYGGISRYFCALASELASIQSADIRIIAPLYVNEYLKVHCSDIAIGRYVRRFPKTGLIINALSSFLFSPIAKSVRPDVIHETYYSERPTYSGNISRALTVYDMIHELRPDSFAVGDPTRRAKASAVQRANHIFCISESTRRDLLDIYQLQEDRVSVTYLGYDDLPETGLSAEDLVGAEPYLLHVGGRHGYKNFEGLLRAYAASAWLRDNFRLICFGAPALTHQERNRICALGLDESRVLHLGGSDERLAALYKGAAAFVYPSQYEGFGIPPLEAMSLDCPVICSSTSSIPEVVGGAGEYFDPHDVESIKDSIERVLQSAERRAELITMGRLRCRLFSWKRCAEETHSVYQRLVA